MVKWMKYKVKIKFRDKVLANIPTSFQALKYVAKKQLQDEGKQVTDEAVEERAEELAEEVGAEETEEQLLAFRRDEKGLYMRESNVKGLFKEAGRILGIRGVQEAVRHGLFVKPEKIYFTRDGEVVKEPDGVVESGIRVMTAKGMRSSIKRAEYLERPELEFELLIIPAVTKRVLTEDRVREILEYGQEIGMGGDRTLGMGKFDLVEFEKVDE